jgi:hypothetical protein
MLRSDTRESLKKSVRNDQISLGANDSQNEISRRLSQRILLSVCVVQGWEEKE